MKKITAVFLLSLAFSMCLIAADSGDKFIKDTLVLLPAGTKVKFNWIMAPGNPPEADLMFRMGRNGSKWIGRDNKYLLEPISGLLIALDGNYDDYTADGSGGLVFISRGYLCNIPPLKSPKTATTNLSMQPVAKLPGDDCRLFPAYGSMVYITGKNNGTNTVYAAGGPDSLVNVEGKGKAFVYRKIFTAPKTPASVAGDGKITYIAMEKLVVSVKQGAGKAEPVFIHKNKDIKGLAYDREAGLFYCTEDGVGYASTEGNMEFLKVQKPEIAMSSGKLYVYLKEKNGLLEIDGIRDFKGYIKKSGVKK